MKILSLLLPAALLAASTSAADTYNYDLNGDKGCVLINVVMDESGSMVTEQEWMREVALKSMVSTLLDAPFGNDHVFVCSHGFGEDSANLNLLTHGFRTLGCSDGYTAGLAAGIFNWDNLNSDDLEDGYDAIVQAIDNVEAEIGGIDLAATCGYMHKNMILITDEERDEVVPETTALDVRLKIKDRDYILNLVVNVLIGTNGQNNIGARFAYDQTLSQYAMRGPGEWISNEENTYLKVFPDLPNEVFAPDLETGDWYYRKPDENENVPYWERENQYVLDMPPIPLVTSLIKSSDTDYVNLVTNTRGAIWAIAVLEEGISQAAEGQPKLSEAFAKAFVDIKVDEICPNADCCVGLGCRVPEVSPTPPSPTPPGGEADPHFTTWTGEHYEYHGQCDIVLAEDAQFANGLGLDIHIRTKIVRFWSYIKNVAIRIGNDILEIEGSAEDNQSNYWINYEYQGELNEFAGFPITIKIASTYKRVYEIDLSSKFPGQKITIKIYKEFVSVKLSQGSKAAFGNTVGLLGDFSTGKTLARDGSTVLDDFTELGNEWQVLPAEPKLFHEVSHPQFPEKCVEPEDPRGERRRRLDENTITEQQAEAACASLKDPLSQKDCVYDILATQDIDMVGAF